MSDRTNLYFDHDGQPHASYADGRPKSPFDGINHAHVDPDARHDITRVGKVYERDGEMIWEGWRMEGAGRRSAGATYGDDPVTGEVVLTHMGGWPLDDLIAIYEEHGEGASVPGSRGPT